MSKRTARGIKRKCQNDECETSFYDLNREEFDCPICGTPFDLEAHATALAQERDAVPDYIRRRQARELPIVSSDDGGDHGADDKEAVDEDEGTDGGTVDNDETAAGEVSNVLPEQEEGSDDALTGAVPLSTAKDE